MALTATSRVATDRGGTTTLTVEVDALVLRADAEDAERSTG